MSNDNVFERLWKLAASANKLVLDGKREPEAFAEVLQQFVFGNVPDINWQITYAALGMSAEYAEVSKKLGVAENPNLWLVPAVKGVTCNKVVATLREVLKPFGLKVGTDIDDLDKDVSTNDRDPNRDGSYVVGFRRTVEADEENANKSANVLKTESHKGATLLERLLPELGYFLTTRHFLDVKNATVCTGSRSSSGYVPGVYFVVDRGEVVVYWDSPGYASDYLRSRSVVSSVIPPA